MPPELTPLQESVRDTFRLLQAGVIENPRDYDHVSIVFWNDSRGSQVVFWPMRLEPYPARAAQAS